MAKIRVAEEMTNEQLLKEFLRMRDELDTLSKKYDSLAKEHYDLKANYNDLKFQYDYLDAKYKQVIAAKYQTQRNTVVIDMPTLFDDLEEETLKLEQEQCEFVEVESYTKRKKAPKEKHVSYDHLERKVETLPIPKGEDICPECGAQMHIKKYEEKEELVVIPAQAYVRVTRIPVLECVECQAFHEDGSSTYRTVSHSFLYERSMCSPELLAYIMDMRYSAGLPLYALEKHFMKLSLEISRQNMCNWVLRSGKYLQPIYDLMKEDFLAYPINHADETPAQVLNEEGKPATSTSYMFVYHTPKWAKPIVLYDYQDSRSGDRAKEFLKGFKGILCTDAYSGYNKVENVSRALCNVHALRKFKEAYKLLPKGKARQNSEEAEAVRRYQEIFDLNNKAEERAAQKYSDQDKRFEYITKVRQRDIKPKFDSFLAWLESMEPKIGRYSMKNAINYVLNNRAGLALFLEDGRIDLGNNIAEISIRPFVTSRNRCKFYVSTTGADVSAKIYSIIITCEQNGINPYMYLMYLFETLPHTDLADQEALRKLLPYSEELPSYVKMMSKKEIRQVLEEEKKSQQES